MIYHPIIQELKTDLFHRKNLSVEVLRLDQTGRGIGGNKWFKLRLNLEEAARQQLKTIITFGGPFSNHIAATAAACKMYGFNCIGIIRGEAHAPLNPTLANANADGMLLHFVSREVYSGKTSETFKNYLFKKFGTHYLIPEGGNNEKGVKGCADILDPRWTYDYIFCACGTGATFSGLVGAAGESTKIVGISVLKGENKLQADTRKMIDSVFPGKEITIAGNEATAHQGISNHCVINTYSFNGYARYDKNLSDFKNNFEERFQIELDHVYTAKLFYALFDLAGQGKLKEGAKVLVLHSGGLQGNAGFELIHPTARKL